MQIILVIDIIKMNTDVTKDKNKNLNYEFRIDDGDYRVSGFGYRHQQCLILFICLATAYSMRACIGVALVGMIEIIPDITTNNVNNSMEGNASASNNFRTSVNETELNVTDTKSGLLTALLLMPPYPMFQWTKKVQDVVISSFFWGYMILQIPAGQLVHKFGPRRLLCGALSINCVVSICFPWATYYGGWIFAVACRIMQGLSQACVVPGLHGFFGQWAPLEERSRLAGFAMGGQAIGSVLGLPITGFIAASPLGWPGIFRFYGILSGLVAALVFFKISDTPAKHPKITLAEQKYIEIGIGLKKGQIKSKMKVPWSHILGSKAIYAIALAHIGQTWGQIILFAEIPSFMSKVMHVDIKSNGLLTALPFLVMWFTNFFFNWFTDWIIVKKYLSVTNARKMATSIGSIPTAAGLILLAFVPKSVIVVEIILCFICAVKISAHVGFMVSHIDIAPNFAGTMMSISNFVSNLVGSQAPLITGIILGNEEASEYKWRYVFILAAALYLITNTAYCVLGTAERAPWNDPDYSEYGIQEKNKPETEPLSTTT